ncbi:MAG: hypothetical protein ACREJ0_00525 [Geminicoccaceae bacterium]
MAERELDGSRLEARFCLMAAGCLSAPNLPDFQGRTSFEGPTYLTGRGPHEEVDFTGRRVAARARRRSHRSRSSPDRRRYIGGVPAYLQKCEEVVANG